MALLKPIENPENAVVCSYWNISHFQADFVNQALTVYMNGFVSETARWDNKKAVTTMQLALNPDVLLSKFLGAGVTVTDIYNEVKAQNPIFDGAEDVLESLQTTESPQVSPATS